MGVHEAAKLASPAVAVPDVGAVWVTLAVGEGVVLAVIGDPGDHGPLDRGGPQRPPARPAEPAGREAPVRQVAVEPDRDPKAGGDIDDREDGQIVPVQRAVPQLPDDEPSARNGTSVTSAVMMRSRVSFVDG